LYHTPNAATYQAVALPDGFVETLCIHASWLSGELSTALIASHMMNLPGKV
jgi:hypothetical protein